MVERRRRVLGMVLAGGHGSRLSPLTAHRAKPAVPFGAKYRIIDFALNNFVNSRINAIYVLTQFRAQSLTEHIQRYWSLGSFLPDQFVTLVPAQMFRYEELGAVWYRGTADAIYQNAHLITGHRPDVVAIFGGDHVFKMDLAHMVQEHCERGADLTIAGYEAPLAEAARFGVLEVDAAWALTGFAEKPAAPKAIPGRPGSALVSMGNYIFSLDALLRLLHEDAQDPNSSHDFGKDVIPRALAQGRRIHVYDFGKNPVPGEKGPNTYWRDIGTLDAYYEASMDLVGDTPEFDLYNVEWPLRTASAWSPPAKFVADGTGRQGRAENSLVSGGVVVSAAEVKSSLLSRRVHVGARAQVEASVLLDDVRVGEGAAIRRAIIDKDVLIPPDATVGLDHAADRARGFVVTERGVVVVPKGYRF